MNSKRLHSLCVGDRPGQKPLQGDCRLAATADAFSHNRYVVVDLRTMSLRDALSYPDDIAHLLLLQLDERVEGTEVELVKVRLHIQLHLNYRECSTRRPDRPLLKAKRTARDHRANLVLKKLVFQRLFPRSIASAFEQWLVVRIKFAYLLHLLVVVRSGKSRKS